ncbi:MAG: phosphatidate cytidylyltransferase [Deltaproteobacteria bacterium]|nr:phosphatidate cytidylyltransferase [Deltaproteobacteria bacterium]
MLFMRIITAGVLAAIILPTLLVGGIKAIAILVAAFVLVGTWELGSRLPGLKSNFSKAILMLVATSLLAMFYISNMVAVAAVVVLVPLAVLAVHLFLYNYIENTIESASQVIFACSYVAIPVGHAILLSRMENGNFWIIYVLVVVCLGDAGAYFGGKYLGRHRFSGNVSPSKTIEGLVGGFAGNLVGMMLMKLIAPSFPPLWTLFQLSVLLAIVAPVGDLCASALKRRLGIKDFGSIMPGHGGVLDRADSLIPTIPVVFYFVAISGHGIVS